MSNGPLWLPSLAWRKPSLVTKGWGAAVDAIRMSVLANSNGISSKCTARPESLLASSVARSCVRLDTTSPRTPSRPSASTTSSAVVPAPRIIT